MKVDLFVANPESYLKEPEDCNIARLGTSFIRSIQSFFAKSNLKYKIVTEPKDYNTTKNYDALSINVDLIDLFNTQEDLIYRILINKKTSSIEVTLINRYINLENRDGLVSLLTQIGDFNCYLDEFLKKDARIYSFSYSSLLGEIISTKRLDNESETKPSGNDRLVAKLY